MRRRALVGQGGLPSGYEKVKYLRSSNKQWIDTGIAINTLTNPYIETTFSMLQNGDKDWFGTSSIDKQTIIYNLCCWGDVSITWYVRYGTYHALDFIKIDSHSVNELYFYNVLKKLKIGGTQALGMYVFVNDTQIGTMATTQDFGFKSTLNLLFFRGRNYTSSAFENFIINNEGNDIRNMVACLDNNGRPCFYDYVSKQTFYNQGTGEFGYEKLDGTYVAPI